MAVQASKTKKTETTKAPVKKTATAGIVIKVLDVTGKESGERTLPKELAIKKPNKALLAQYMRMYQANRRKGTASTKTRGEVVGSTRKIYRQKGTGNARHGDIKAPIFVGGGVVGGPKPRDYELRMNKKQKKQSLREAFALKLQEKNIYGISDEFLTIKPKTKTVATFIKNSNLGEKSVLIVLPQQNTENLMRAARNIPQVTLERVATLNPYSLLSVRSVLIADTAIQDVISRLLNS